MWTVVNRARSHWPTCEPARVTLPLVNWPAVYAIVWTVILIAAFVRLRRRRSHIGSAAAGIVYDMINEDKRKAVEIVVEERAGARDPEDKDGNLPDLEAPRRH